MLTLILVVLALVFFSLAAFRVPNTVFDFHEAALACLTGAWLSMHFGGLV